MNDLLPFLRGMLVATCLVAAVFFARFYRRSGDRLFAAFAIAFALLAVNWTGVAFTGPRDEARTWFVVVRLFAFVGIIVAIIQKNREK